MRQLLAQVDLSEKYPVLRIWRMTNAGCSRWAGRVSLRLAGALVVGARRLTELKEALAADAITQQQYTQARGHALLPLNVHTQSYVHASMHACIHTCMRACMHAYIHTYIHRYIDT